jgi:hypothetical protein
LPLAVVRFLVAELELQQAVDFPVEHGALSAFRRVLTGHAPMSRPLRPLAKDCNRWPCRVARLGRWLPLSARLDAACFEIRWPSEFVTVRWIDRAWNGEFGWL